MIEYYAILRTSHNYLTINEDNQTEFLVLKAFTKMSVYMYPHTLVVLG